jgi:hypothetical protein
VKNLENLKNSEKVENLEKMKNLKKMTLYYININFLNKIRYIILIFKFIIVII